MSTKLFLATLVTLVISLPQPISAALNQKTKTITIVNPIRGRGLWRQPDITPFEKQYQVVKDRQLPATWLVQYDALLDSEVVELLRSFGSDQEIGLFLEVSEKLASDVGVAYKIASGDWARPDKVYLSGYRLLDRKKMIDRLVSEFRQKLGFAPTVAGAWHVDPASLNYLKKKHELVATVGVADQFDTDANRQWGQYWGYPYYPSKFNALKPAQTLAEKLDVVKIQWAQRDPLLGYGPSPHFSNFSLQANDYVSAHQLTTEYFQSVLNAYLNAQVPLTQATVGLEVGQEGFIYSQEFTRQLDLVKTLEGQGVLVLTMSQFAKEYKASFPELPPQVIMTGSHSAGTLEPQLKNSQVIWFMSPKVRARLIKTPDKLLLQDLRVYPEYFPAIDLWRPQPIQRVIRQLPAAVDHITREDQRELTVDPEEFLENLSEENLVALAEDQVESSYSLASIRVGSLYEHLKAVVYNNLAHFVWSRLDKVVLVGIKISPTTFAGITWPFSIGQADLQPQALAHFINLGQIVDRLPQWPSGPDREIVKYTYPGSFQVLDHDQVNSPEFRQWKEKNPGKKRLFSNSLIEVWHQ